MLAQDRIEREAAARPAAIGIAAIGALAEYNPGQSL